MNFSQVFTVYFSRFSSWFFRWRFGGVFACASTVSFTRGISCFKSRLLCQTNVMHVIIFHLLTIAELFLGFNAISLGFSGYFSTDLRHWLNLATLLRRPCKSSCYLYCLPWKSSCARKHNFLR